MIAIPRSEPLANAIAESQAFAVNVLADHQAGLAETFKGKDPTFAVKHWWPFGRLPLLQGAAARFECDVQRTHINGTHLLVIGTVTRAQRGQTRPLAYTRRGYAAPRRWLPRTGCAGAGWRCGAACRRPRRCPRRSRHPGRSAGR